MPRLLLTAFTTFPGPTRSAVQLRHVAQELARSHEVDILVVRSPAQSHVERAGNIRILRVPTPSPHVDERISTFRRALGRQIQGDYDAVHFCDPYSGITVLESRQRAPFATVYDLTRGPDIGLRELADGELRQYEHDRDTCIQAADMTLVASDHMRRAITGVAKRVHIVGTGTDIELFDYYDTVPSGPPVVLCTGTLAKGRGLRILLRAIPALRKQTDLRVLIAGAGTQSFRNELVDNIRLLGLEGIVRLMPAVEYRDMPTLISRASICVVPYAPESSTNPMTACPTKLVEYMACRRPVIAARRSSVTARFTDGIHALLFSQSDPSDLASKLLTLVREPALAQNLAQAGYDYVRNHCSASASKRQLRRAYAQLLPHRVLAVRCLGESAFASDIALEAERSPVDPAISVAGRPAEGGLTGAPSPPTAAATETDIVPRDPWVVDCAEDIGVELASLDEQIAGSTWVAMPPERRSHEVAGEILPATEPGAVDGPWQELRAVSGLLGASEHASSETSSKIKETEK